MKKFYLNLKKFWLKTFGRVAVVYVMKKPLGAKWVAKDYNGNVYFYESKPVIDEQSKSWFQKKGKPCLSKAYDVEIEGDWRESLRKVKEVSNV